MTPPPNSTAELDALPAGAEIARFDGAGKVRRLVKDPSGAWQRQDLPGPSGLVLAEALAVFAAVPVLEAPAVPMDREGATATLGELAQAAAAEDKRHPADLAAWWSVQVFRPLEVADAVAVLGWSAAKAAFRQAYNEAIGAAR